MFELARLGWRSGAPQLLLLVLLTFALRLLRFWAAVQGVAHFTGHGWAWVICIILALLVLRWPLRVAAAVGAWLVWHWPWPVCIFFGMPRLVLMIPGWLSMLKARWRHPPPVWSRKP